MLIGDSVLLQRGNDIFRPSDVGTPVEIAGTWTLRFNNGVSITTTGDTQFMELSTNRTVEDWVSLDNMSRFTCLGYREPFNCDIEKWDSNIDLSEYINKSGSFDIGNLDFAKFAGFFVKGVKTSAKKPNAYVLDKKKFGEQITYCKKLYPEGYVEETGNQYFLKKCWVDELLDVFFNFTDVTSIPDELMFKVTDDWIEAFRDGFFSACIYDTSKDCYRASLAYSQFLSDYNILTMRIGQGMQVSERQDESSGSTDFVIKFPRSIPMLNIIDGFENLSPKLVYDVGSGEFNASGIKVKG